MKDAGYFGPENSTTIAQFAQLHIEGLKAANMMSLFDWNWHDQFAAFDNYCGKEKGGHGCIGEYSNILYPPCFYNIPAWTRARKEKSPP